MNSGKVWFVGAGPGDGGLLTIKGKAAIELSDVIVYDALVSLEILSQIPKEKEMIYVGKNSGHHPIPQNQINEILLNEARKRKKVVRLKGGDPFVFGRGGEEVETLIQEGVPFEVVSGVTAGVAVPAYGGIPLTHRDYTSSVHFITGHHRKDGESTIDYPALVKLDGTLVFYMGVTAMKEICDGLLLAGMSENTPAAVLEKGTTAKQRRVVSSLKNLVIDAEEMQISAPALIVIGKVCSLSKEFQWAENRPLGGRQFLVTRPRKPGKGFGDKLRELGAQVVELPAIETVEIPPNKEFKESISSFIQRKTEGWLVFTSPVGVQVFMRQLLESKWDLRDLVFGLEKMKIGAIGSATAKELKEWGLQADLVPAKYCARELGEELARTARKGSHILIPRARKGSEELLPPLLEAGFKVDDLAVYDTCHSIHTELKVQIQNGIERGEIDGVTFTSASCVQAFVKTMDCLDFSKVQGVCIGEQTRAEAEKYGMKVVVSKEATIESMTEKLIEEYREKV